MYELKTPTYMTLKEACEYLGVQRYTLLRLCQKRIHHFPAVKVGNRWQIDAGKLYKWREDWFEGKFEI